jgi:hypothetical protein
MDSEGKCFLLSSNINQIPIHIHTVHNYCLFACQDLSYGAEHVPVPCVNCVDHSLPDYVSYSTKREPTDGVDLNLDPEFLIGCECTDDCQVCSFVMDRQQLINITADISVFSLAVKFYCTDNILISD